jgi:hypothetical protein
MIINSIIFVKSELTTLPTDWKNIPKGVRNLSV